MRHDIREAKRKLPLPELMRQLGLEDHARKSARCPFHDDRNNSFSVYKDNNGDWRWKCFAECGGGDEIEFLARWEKIDNAAACRRLISLTGAGATQTEIRQREKHGPPKAIPDRIAVMPDSVANAWNEGVDYLLAHPVNAERLATFRGWPVLFAQHIIDCAAISLPLYHNERGIAFQVVAPEGQRGAMTTRPVGYHIRLRGKPGEKATWRFLPNEKEHGQGIPALPYLIGEFERARLLVITEGQWDALTFAFAAGWLGDGCLWPESVGVIGIRGASGVNPFLRWYERFWPDRANCLLLADADKAGNSWSEGEAVLRSNWRSDAPKLPLSIVTRTRTSTIYFVPRNWGKMKSPNCWRVTGWRLKAGWQREWRFNEQSALSGDRYARATAFGSRQNITGNLRLP